MAGPSGRSPFPRHSFGGHNNTSNLNASRNVDRSSYSTAGTNSPPLPNNGRLSFSHSATGWTSVREPYSTTSSSRPRSGSIDLSLSPTSMSFASSVAVSNAGGTAGSRLSGATSSYKHSFGGSTRAKSDASTPRMGDEGYTPRNSGKHFSFSSSVGTQKDDLSANSNASRTHHDNKLPHKSFHTTQESDCAEGIEDEEQNCNGVHIPLENSKKSVSRIDDENDHIRSLAQKALDTHTSPASASFYASILYTRTNLPEDALLYAKSLAANDEGKRAVLLLERSGLLLAASSTNINSYRHHNMNVFEPLSFSIEMQISASLIASKCLSNLGEWEEACSIVEEACRYPPHGKSNQMPGSIIEDGEDPQLTLLAMEVANNHKSVSIGEIHPVARLCCMRGKIYDELSNPTRASSWLKAALKIDPYCVEALDYLFGRHFLGADEERELVDSLHFKSSSNDDYWLKDYYLAKVSNPLDSRFNHDESYTISSELIEREGENDDGSKKAMLQQSSALSPVLKTDASAIHPHNTPSRSPDYINPSMPHNLLSPEKSFQKSYATPLMRLLTIHNLSTSPEMLSLYAEHAYTNHHTSHALHICQASQSIDPLNPRPLFIHAASLLALSQKRELFHLAHVFVNANPRLAIGWFTVGCYYMSCKKYEVAQRHFCRATRLEPRCAEAWIAFGCSFAAADESDQALASYRAAQRLFSGSHVPMLYMGMEYLRTNHLSLAGHFLTSAGRMNRTDPLSFNELGVCAFRLGDYREALGLFVHALRLCVKLEFTERQERDVDIFEHALLGENPKPKQQHICSSRYYSTQNENINVDVESMSDSDCMMCCQDSFWEPTIFNLGQSYRKIRQYDEAAICFEKAISLVPGNAGSYAALGYAKHLLGDVDSAIECYHQALGMKPDDTFCGEMLNRALHESIKKPDPLFGVFDPGKSPAVSRSEKLDLSSKRGDSISLHNSSFNGFDSGKESMRRKSAFSMATDESSNLSLDCSDVDMSMS